MLTIAFIAQKGGTGKTTLAINLAAAAAQDGRVPLVIDIDPQVSACNWSDRRGQKDNPPYVSDGQAARLQTAIQKAETMGIDTVLIDTPAKSGEAGLAAAKVADLVIIPCRPQELDIETLDSVKKILTMADQPPSIVVLNAVPHLGWGRQQEARREISAKGFEVAAQSIANLAAFGDATKRGQSVLEFQQGGRAAQEIIEVYKQVSLLLDKKESRGAGHGAGQS
jgi:chromosome partitioning protein